MLVWFVCRVYQYHYSLFPFLVRSVYSKKWYLCSPYTWWLLFIFHSVYVSFHCGLASSCLCVVMTEFIKLPTSSLNGTASKRSPTYQAQVRSSQCLLPMSFCTLETWHFNKWHVWYGELRKSCPLYYLECSNTASLFFNIVVYLYMEQKLAQTVEFIIVAYHECR